MRVEEKKHAINEVMFTFKKARIYFIKSFFFFLALIVCFYIVSVFTYIDSYSKTKENVISFFVNKTNIISIYDNENIISYESYDFKNIENYGDTLLEFKDEVSFNSIKTKRLKLTDNIYLVKFVKE